MTVVERGNTDEKTRLPGEPQPGPVAETGPEEPEGTEGPGPGEEARQSGEEVAGSPVPESFAEAREDKPAAEQHFEAGGALDEAVPVAPEPVEPSAAERAEADLLISKMLGEGNTQAEPAGAADSKGKVEPSGPVIRPAVFEEFTPEPGAQVTIGGMDLLMDVPLSVTVELGKARCYVRDILNLTVGSVIELERLAGDPVDVLVNGKPIAKGEVVVLDENFGVRIQEIVSGSTKTRKERTR
jgi:flagellar motor switch protein FliN